jgi:hypothetical protein
LVRGKDNEKNNSNQYALDISPGLIREDIISYNKITRLEQALAKMDQKDRDRLLDAFLQIIKCQ